MFINTAKKWIFLLICSQVAEKKLLVLEENWEQKVAKILGKVTKFKK
jgi:hypothetical protein